jgi:hypothetical protein
MRSCVAGLRAVGASSRTTLLRFGSSALSGCILRELDIGLRSPRLGRFALVASFRTFRRFS